MVICQVYNVSLSINRASLEFNDVGLGEFMQYALIEQCKLSEFPLMAAADVSAGLLSIELSKEDLPSVAEKTKPVKRPLSSPIASNGPRPKAVRCDDFQSFCLSWNFIETLKAIFFSCSLLSHLVNSTQSS